MILTPGMSIMRAIAAQRSFFSYAEEKGEHMETSDALNIIFTRRSIRRFSPRPVEVQKQKILLRAAFAAPSAENSQTKRFIVITERDRLDALPALHPSAGPARDVPLAVIVCCDTSADPQTVFWPQDCAVATQNLMLAARALDLGALWCGIHPVEAREQAFISAFSLPGMVRPFSLVLIGYPLQDFFDENRYDPHMIYADLWGRPCVLDFGEEK